MGLKELFLRKKASLTVTAPVAGKIVTAAEIADPTFSTGVLGLTMGIQPTGHEICAPADGEVTAFFETCHAICMKTAEGAELLVHVGIDTVSLAGKYFSPKVTEGAKVRRGDLLLAFDREAMEQAGYDVTTAVILTNPDDFASVELCTGEVETGDPLMKITI